MAHPGNRVLKKDASFSSNFYKSDGILSHYLIKHTAPDAIEYVTDKLAPIEWDAATVMDALTLNAEKHGPVHVNARHMARIWITSIFLYLTGF